MDIEGAEFEVLEHLLRTRKASLIDTMVAAKLNRSPAAGTFMTPCTLDVRTGH